MNDDRCVVSFGRGYNFERGLVRLEEGVRKFSNVPFFGYREYPAGCPPHEESPYAFKYFCIKECYDKGFRNIIWCDASVVIQQSLEDLFSIIEIRGYYFVKYGDSMGEWCHDRALTTLGITRDKSMELPMIVATNFGLNLNKSYPKRLLNKMMELAVDGITFPGSYTNAEEMCSKHPRVLGHRHDQTALSVISTRCGMMECDTNESKPWFIHDREYVKDGVECTCKDVDMSE